MGSLSLIYHLFFPQQVPMVLLVPKSTCQGLIIKMKSLKLRNALSITAGLLGILSVGYISGIETERIKTDTFLKKIENSAGDITYITKVLDLEGFRCYKKIDFFGGYPLSMIEMQTIVEDRDEKWRMMNMRQFKPFDKYSKYGTYIQNGLREGPVPDNSFSRFDELIKKCEREINRNGRSMGGLKY